MDLCLMKNAAGTKYVPCRRRAHPQIKPVKDYYLFYYSFMRPSFRDFYFDDETEFEVRVLDTWNMTAEKKGVYKGRFRMNCRADSTWQCRSKDACDGQRCKCAGYCSQYTKKVALCTVTRFAMHRYEAFCPISRWLTRDFAAHRAASLWENASRYSGQ